LQMDRAIQDGGVFTNARNRGWPHFDVEGTNFSVLKVLRMKLGRRVKCQRERDASPRLVAVDLSVRLSMAN